MVKTILLIGGARSGKTKLALELAECSGLRPCCYLATAVAKDQEMAERIKLHQAQRGPSWKTIEEPLDIVTAIEAQLKEGSSAIVVDCLTLWLMNLLERFALSEVEEYVLRASENLKEIKALYDGLCVFVTNEVGMGIVPDNPLSRAFRDLEGRTNQVFAGVSDEVYLVVAGLKMKIK
ncbi:MAG: bifunctional adenosylcobinamide kinase/adenosylcobinamide-phosphate guanylyltransferase [Nitrospirae bacterium]|nr:MAG: bifunctional adenosylcobinamide kinase/adenosylcobinamide-phosphate guanylyltransferase [Nitrospirota bacterium]